MDTDDDYGTGDDSALVRDLRKQLKEALSAKREGEEALGALKAQIRTQSISDLLKARGFDPQVAKFVPSEVDGDDSLAAWLEENGALFGGKPESAPAVPEETAREQRRLGAVAERGVAPDRAGDLEARMAGAKSKEEINQILSEFQRFVL